MKSLVAAIILASMAALLYAVSAAPDENQRVMTQQVMQAKQKLAAAEAATGAESARR